jgi:hypothetical protein
MTYLAKQNRKKAKKMKFPNVNYDSLIACLDLEKLFGTEPLMLTHQIDMALAFIDVGASNFNMTDEGRPICFEQDIKGPLSNIITRMHAFNKRSDRGNKLFKEEYLITMCFIDNFEGSVHVYVEPLPEFYEVRTTTLCISFIKMNDNSPKHNILIPLQYILTNYNINPKSYMGYVHSLMYIDYDGKTRYWEYAGITGRNWTTRLNEHINEAGRGSKKTFHKLLNESFIEGSTNIEHSLCKVNATYDEIMQWEERKVDQIMNNDDISCANMIPGGFKGIKFLHLHRKLGTQRPTLLERESAIADYLKENPRAGMSNDTISALWANNPSYAESVICNQPNRLSAKTVRDIRALHSQSIDTQSICEQLNIDNKRKVQSVIRGITYSRIT